MAWTLDQRSSQVSAQDGPPRDAQRAGPGGGGGGGADQRRPFMGGGGMMAPGSMVTMGKHIFVLVGGTLYKIDPETMEVVKTLEVVKRDETRLQRQPGENPDPNATRRPPQ
jgi:hypothetical protein